MYEKFTTEIKHTINDKLYFNGKYFIEKTIISTYIYHELLKKLIQYKFTFAELREEGFSYPKDNCFEFEDFIFDDEEPDFKEIPNQKNDNINKIFLKDKLKGVKEDSDFYSVDKSDLTTELNKYCPDPTKQKVYLFNETWYKGEKLPIYNSLTYLGDYWGIWDYSINKINLREFMDEYDNKMNRLIYQQALKPNLVHDYFFYLHYLGDKINYYLDEDRFQTRFFRNCEKALNKTDDLALYYFIKEVLDTFLAHASEKKAFIRCQHCGQIIKFAENKKYCSLAVDRQDCGKSARNKKYYSKKKTN